MDDFLAKKRDSGPVLDFSKVTVNTKEEFRQIFDRVPDFKMKAEKVRPEDAKVRDNVKKMKFKTSKKDFKLLKEQFTFKDPTPEEMKGLKLEDLAKVPIDWKMLTSIRPKNKMDEDFYSRIVELKKAELKTQALDKRNLMRDPQLKRVKSKSGSLEYRPLNCVECMDDFCTGTACTQLLYDCFTRIELEPAEPASKVISIDLGTDKSKKKSKKKKGRSRSPRKSDKKKKTVNKRDASRKRSKSPKKTPKK
ncbi:uncharacterized protein [Atheta coriaria]|uniref:uncharacterized protein n=1 Tax=Dalotia coriaria TaxID=877792 RepID=UPI0031F43860